MNFEKERKLCTMLGIGFKNMTIYKAELIHLRNDGYTAKEMSEMLNEPITKVQHWYKGSQPRDEIINKLEKMYFERERKTIEKLRKGLKD